MGECREGVSQTSSLGSATEPEDRRNDRRGTDLERRWCGLRSRGVAVLGGREHL